MAASPEALRDSFLQTLDHVGGAFGRTRAASGPRRPLQAPDLHKLSEGLLLSSWTHWEALCRGLFILDLALDPDGVLRRDVSKFRYKGSAWRLAYAVADHPDERKFVDWSDYDAIRQRADAWLAPGHRYGVLPRKPDLLIVKRIRNAIAHRSDQAWDRFMTMIQKPPFSLTARQRMGITPGRFISTHSWNGVPVLNEVVNSLEASARALVP